MGLTTISAEDTYTEWMRPKQMKSHGMAGAGFLDISAKGVWDGTLVVQKTHDDPTSASPEIFDVEEFTENFSKLCRDHAARVYYRVGFKTSGYVSGDAEIGMYR